MNVKNNYESPFPTRLRKLIEEKRTSQKSQISLELQVSRSHNGKMEKQSQRGKNFGKWLNIYNAR